ncbi:MAG TPA: XrtA/PEP-CTERM system TPR-repeat protein PrsT [Micropepsaceae bacterium]
MSGKNGSRKTRRYALATLWMLGVPTGIYGGNSPAEAAVPIPNTEAASPMSLDTKKLLDDAQSAQSRGELGLAIIQLKNAVRLTPRNGEVRARLGMALLKSGDTRTAERELRQARKDNAPEDLVVPAILDAMIVRGEARELLEEFADPSLQTQSKIAADILRARALALQIVGRSADANAAMARSLSLRRDTRGLIAKAKLAMQQRDFALARTAIDEAAKLSPSNEEVLLSQIALLFQSGDAKKTLAAADDFIRRTPNSTIGRVMRIEALLALKQDKTASDDVDTLEMAVPESSFIPYYRGLIFARAGDYKDAWHLVETLHPEFILAQPAMAMLVAEIAIASGNIESGGAILATLVSRRPELTAARVRLAGVQLQLKSPTAALKTLEPIKTNADPEIQALFGQASLQLGRFSDAIGSLEKAIDASSAKNTDALQLDLAESAFGYGDIDRAIRALEQIKAHGPTDWQTAIPLIASLVQAGKYQEAVEVVDGIAKSAGRTPLVPFYRARVLAAASDLAGASAAFGEALAIDPKFVPALYFRAHVLVARGNPEAGKKDLRQVLALDPRNVPAYIALAQISLHEGEESQSVGLLNSAIRVAPNDPTPRLTLATYQTSQGKYQDARATVNALLKIAPNDPATLMQLGQIQFLSGDTGKAIETFRSLAATYTTAAGTYVVLAKVLHATKDRLAAIDAAKRAVELDPFSPKIRGLLVEYLIAGDRPDEAIANAREYVSSHPGTDADLLLAAALIGVKRQEEASAYLTTRLAAKPDRLLALRLSQLAMDMGNRKKALDILAEWLRKSPGDYDVGRQYGASLLQIGDVPAARKEFETLLMRRPEDPVVLNDLGWILRDDDPARALSLVTLAVKIVPDSTQILDTLAWIKFQRRDLQGALLLLRRAHSLDTGDGEVGFHFAVALDATGRRAEAKTLLQSVVEKNLEFTDKDNAKKLLARW